MGEAVKPDLGIYHEMLLSLPLGEPTLSFLARDWPDVDPWRDDTRKKIVEQMNFSQKGTPLNSSIDSSRREDGLIVEEISYDMPFGPRTRGLFLRPEARDRLPSVVALHDHGGFFYYGKEKIVETGLSSPLLLEHKVRAYGGRSWATELAKRGYAVLCVDSFMWGSRKIPIDTINKSYHDAFKGLEPGSDEYISAYNNYWDSNEARITMSTVLNAGTTWPGIVLYEDQRSIDYLLTRPEIDPKRIGCGGLSGGGLRSAFLTGFDPRIKAGFVVGWMCTLRSMLQNHIQGHNILMYVPNLINTLDIPDVATLHGPAPLMVLYDREDGLFPLEGQVEAHEKIAKVYQKMGMPERYVGKFYPGRHKFDLQMQEDAFAWLGKNL